MAKSRRGFASMPREKQREIARKGGKARAKSRISSIFDEE